MAERAGDYKFLTAQEAWDALIDYRQKYYSKYIAAYSGDRSELSLTSDPGLFWKRNGKCRIHVPLAADIAATSADLMFSEEPIFTCYDDETEANESKQQKRLDELVEKNNIHGKLNEGAETCAALGDVYLKLNYRKNEVDYPLLNVVQGDSAWPEYLLGVLKGIHFFSVAKTNSKTGEIIRAYERYEPGKITMEMYRGDANTLGLLLDTKVLRQYGFEREIIPPVDDMLAVHIPNIRPNRSFRDIPNGRSDYDELRNLMDSLDETYSSWMRDIRLGKARTIVPVDYLKRKPAEMLDGVQASGKFEFDEDVESLVALDIDTDKAGGNPITLSQFAIRSAEHSASCMDLMRNIVSMAGYAPQTFGIDIDGFAQSGTALHIREKKSYGTRGKKQTYWKAPLEQIMTAMVHLDNALWPEKGSDADDSVKVRFSDTLSSDINTMASAVQMLKAANAASTELCVQMLHPDWTKKQISEETERLKNSEYLDMLRDGIMTKAEVRAALLNEDEATAAKKIAEIWPDASEKTSPESSAGQGTGQATGPQAGPQAKEIPAV